MSQSDRTTDVYSPPVPGPPSEPLVERGSPVGDVLGLVGTEIHGGYVVEELVSSDGLSLVYRATSRQAGTTAALKCFYGLRDLAPESLSAFRDRFRRITSLLGGLSADQPSMVRVLGQGWMAVQNKEIPCMLTEWVDGASLESLLDRERRKGAKRRSAEDVFGVMRGPMKALAAAHSVGLTHRDIKPSNLFVDNSSLARGANIRLMDYALARLEGEPFDDAVTFLTPEYAAPEQFMGYEHLVGPWTDVFSMALVLLEIMLGGRQVMPGDSFEALRDACLDEEHRPTPRTFGLDVSDDVELVFHRALEIDVHRRYHSGAHFMGALSRAIEQRTSAAASGVIRASGEFLHDPSHYITRNRKAPVAPRRTTLPANPVITQVTPVPIAPSAAPVPVTPPAVITGETVIARPPSRTGNTVIAPVPEFNDS